MIIYFAQFTIVLQFFLPIKPVFNTFIVPRAIVLEKRIQHAKIVNSY